MKKIIAFFAMTLFVLAGAFAQIKSGIVAYEYWFDENFDTRKNIPTDSLDIFQLDTEFEAADLSAGLHSIHFRFMDFSRNWSSVTSNFFQKLPEQNQTDSLDRQIIKYETWLNSDYASAKTVSATPQKTLTVDSLFDMNDLSVGLHTFHFRASDNTGQWSSVTSNFFQKLPEQNQMDSLDRQIIKYETWLNDDYASAKTVLQSPQKNLEVDSLFDMNDLSVGLHTFHFRASDNTGQWSSVTSNFFQKLPEQNQTDSLDRQIIKYETWLNDDYASAKTVLQSPQKTLEVDSLFDMNDLSVGLHTFHFRSSDNTGQWSSVTSNFFQKLPEQNQTDSLDRQIIKYETWLDSDFDSRKTITTTPKKTLEVDSLFDMNDLSVGLHTFHFRANDNTGQWSSVTSNFFQKLPRQFIADSVDRKIVAAEWWMDNDFASKTLEKIDPGVDKYLFIKDFNIGCIDTGAHEFHIRFRDDTGQWSSVTSSEFKRNGALQVSETVQICAGETYGDYSETGMYIDTFSVSNGCDSIHTLDLTVLDTSRTERFDTVCSGMTGTEIEVLQNQNGCDSTVVTTTSLAPEIIILDSLVTGDNGTGAGAIDLTVNSLDYLFEWSDGITTIATTEDVDNLPIGNYSVTITNQFGCELTAEFMIIATSTLDLEKFGLVKIMPNPFESHFQIDFSKPFSGRLKITDVSGKLILTKKIDHSLKTEIDLSSHVSGIYILDFGQKGKSIQLVKI